MKFLLYLYLLVGELPAVAFWYWAGAYCRRFVPRAKPNWRDLLWVAGIQLLWPIALILTPVPVVFWRRAVQREVCVCGHTRSQHSDKTDWAGIYDRCTYEARSAAFLVRGEGSQFIRCGCRKFTKPNVRRRR